MAIADCIGHSDGIEGSAGLNNQVASIPAIPKCIKHIEGILALGVCLLHTQQKKGK
jgi:hypothetical protein